MEAVKKLIPWAALITAFSVGTAWATVEWKVGEMERQLDRIDARVTALYCAQVPSNLREACR